MKREIFEALRAGTQVPLVRAICRSAGREQLIDLSKDRSPLGEAARLAVRSDKSSEVEHDGEMWFLEVHNPPLDLILIGAVHIAQPLAQMAMLAGYGVRVIDPRAAFATHARFPGTMLAVDWPDTVLAEHPPGARSALVALAHDPKIDDPALSFALRSPAFYIGALGSRKSHAARLERLTAAGFDETQRARVRGPVGLAIGARSPAEIAISILAQITETLRT